MGALNNNMRQQTNQNEDSSQQNSQLNIISSMVDSQLSNDFRNSEFLANQDKIKKINDKNNARYTQEVWQIPERNQLRIMNNYISSQQKTNPIKVVKESSFASVKSKSRSFSGFFDLNEDLKSYADNYRLPANMDFTIETPEVRDTLDTNEVNEHVLGRRKMVNQPTMDQLDPKITNRFNSESKYILFQQTIGKH